MYSLQFVLTAHLFILSALGLCGSHCINPDIGPKTIVRYEGEDDVFIPCPIYGFYLPVWEINGKVYGLFSLPSPYLPALSGLIIPTVTLEMDGTTFLCYYSTGTGFEVGRSSLGKLTVKKREDIFVDESVKKNTVNYVRLDHQNMSFSKSNTQIAWKPPHNNHCGDYKTKVEVGHTLNRNSIFYTNTTTAMSLNISNSVLRDTFINITFLTGKDFNTACESVEMPILFKSSVVTKTLKASFSRSISTRIQRNQEDNSIIFIVLPTMAGSSEPDCRCPVFIDPNYKKDCVSVNSCQCINDTAFLSPLKLCNATEGELLLQFVNLTNQINGSHIHFFYFLVSEDVQIVYRQYVSSFEILELLPEPPMLSWVMETNEVDFFSQPMEGILLDKYELTVYDVTGEQLYDDSFPVDSVDSNYSVNIGIFLTERQFCAPFIVSVKASNPFGYSDTNITINEERAQGDVCTCLNRKISVDTKYVKMTWHTDKISVTLKCTQTYASDVKLKVVVDRDDEYNVNDHQDRQWVLPCNQTKSHTFSSLDCKKKYNLSVHWISPNEISFTKDCILSVKEVQSSCQHHQIVVNTSSAAAALAFLIIIIIILVYIKFCYTDAKKKCRCCMGS